jgi:hypothetical protein
MLLKRIKIIPPWQLSVDPSKTPAHICEFQFLDIRFSTDEQVEPLKIFTFEFLRYIDSGPRLCSFPQPRIFDFE